MSPRYESIGTYTNKKDPSGGDGGGDDRKNKTKNETKNGTKNETKNRTKKTKKNEKAVLADGGIVSVSNNKRSFQHVRFMPGTTAKQTTCTKKHTLTVLCV